jgi:hypothetical protein
MQEAGAVAVLVVNSGPGPLVRMPGLPEEAQQVIVASGAPVVCLFPPSPVVSVFNACTHSGMIPYTEGEQLIQQLTQTTTGSGKVVGKFGVAGSDICAPQYQRQQTLESSGLSGNGGDDTAKGAAALLDLLRYRASTPTETVPVHRRRVVHPPLTVPSPSQSVTKRPPRPPM